MISVNVGGLETGVRLTLLSFRVVASLTILGGQKFHFPHFSSNFNQFLLHIYFSSKFSHFLPKLGSSGGRVAWVRVPHPGRPWLRFCLVSDLDITDTSLGLDFKL